MLNSSFLCRRGDQHQQQVVRRQTIAAGIVNSHLAMHEAKNQRAGQAVWAIDHHPPGIQDEEEEEEEDGGDDENEG